MSFMIYDLPFTIYPRAPRSRRLMKKQTQFAKNQTCLFVFICGSICLKMLKNAQKFTKTFKKRIKIRILYLVSRISRRNFHVHLKKQTQFPFTAEDAEQRNIGFSNELINKSNINHFGVLRDLGG